MYVRGVGFLWKEKARQTDKHVGRRRSMNGRTDSMEGRQAFWLGGHTVRYQRCGSKQPSCTSFFLRSRRLIWSGRWGVLTNGYRIASSSTRSSSSLFDHYEWLRTYTYDFADERSRFLKTKFRISMHWFLPLLRNSADPSLAFALLAHLLYAPDVSFVSCDVSLGRGAECLIHLWNKLINLERTRWGSSLCGAIYEGIHLSQKRKYKSFYSLLSFFRYPTPMTDMTWTVTWPAVLCTIRQSKILNLLCFAKMQRKSAAVHPLHNDKLARKVWCSM